MNRTLALIFILGLFGCQPEEQPTKDPFEHVARFVDQYSEATVSQGNVNSMSVAVYRSGRAYHNYYGEMTSGSGEKPNDQSLFEIASISKIFTGSLVARAVVDKKINLDDDIRVYLPGDFPNLEFEGRPVTIRDVVTHTLGFDTPARLDSVYKSIFAGNYDETISLYDMDDLFDELEMVELSYSPGTYYDYNNVGPEIAAYILEQVYGKTYREMLALFLKDLGMENTYLQDYERHKGRLVTGYTEEGELATIDGNPLIGGASGIITTLPDLVKFMKYQLESEDPLITESTKILFEDEDELTGYFWDLGFAEVEGFYYYKSGTSNGTQSIILLCPDADYGQILLMNNTSDEATSDWISLYNRIEYDLIKYPKINLWSLVEPIFREDRAKGKEQYTRLLSDTAQYFASSEYLNNVGYSYLYNEDTDMAIGVFELAVSADPENSNLYDSLGEAYFMAKNYKESKANFEMSLKLDPSNTNAKEYIEEIKRISS